MDKNKVPKPGERYRHFKDKPYQIITVAIHSETGEPMVVYQALYGDFSTYVRPLDMFLSEVDHVKYPNVKQKYRFERVISQENIATDVLEAANGTIENQALKTDIQRVESQDLRIVSKTIEETEDVQALEISTPDLESMEAYGEVSSLLLEFLDAESYSEKLDILISNKKQLSDRLINDMAVSLDCMVNEGPLDQRIQELIGCLQAMIRFEDRRLR